MDTGSAAELSDTHNRGLDVLARDHHEVGELVDDDDEIGHLSRRVVVVIECARGLLLVEGRYLSHAHALEDLESALHLGHSPLQCTRSLLGFGDDGHVEVRQAVVSSKLDALRVDHDEAHVLGIGTHEERHHDRVDHDGLAGTGGTRDEEVGHLGEVSHDGRPFGIATDRELERATLHVGQDVAQVHILALAVGNLDARPRRVAP